MIRIIACRFWRFYKTRTLGNWLSNPNRWIQEHLETTYAVGFLRITIKHKLKFVEDQRNNEKSFFDGKRIIY